MVDNNADLNKLIQKAAMVLSTKIKREKVAEVQNVLNSEFPVDHSITDTGMSALSFACAMTEVDATEQARNQKMLTAILQCNPNLNHEDNFKRTPLHLACISGNGTAVQLLLQSNAVNVNAQSAGGETPLMKAAAAGRLEICQILLKGGANAKMTCMKNLTALDFAQIN